MKHFLALLPFVFLFQVTFCQEQPKARPKPSSAQRAWHQMEFYLFFHFGPNTFSGKEWGHGDEKEEIFNPSTLDCRQWCRIAKAAGAKGVIITAKHHDGFCLWPSKFSTHTVRESKWRNGKGDVLKELSAACKEYGLKFGVYLSPWDRNHPDYGSDKYNDVFINMMKEIFTSYGPIWEFWWDGANGEGPNGKKQQYDFKRFENFVKKISPQTMVFSDIGPDCRWVGNENGVAGITNWNYLDTAGFKRGNGAPPADSLNSGNRYGASWIPAECDVSIRPGWFYHKDEDSKVKTAKDLFQLYLKSVGRGANLLLNVPPDQRGLINEIDSASIVDFGKLRERNFKTNAFRNAAGYYFQQGILKKITELSDGNPATVQVMEGTAQYSAGLTTKEDKKINTVVLKESLYNGQHCALFQLLLFNNSNQLVKELYGSTIGNKRILSFPEVNASRIEITILKQDGPTAISEIEAYDIDEQLIENK